MSRLAEVASSQVDVAPRCEQEETGKPNAYFPLALFRKSEKHACKEEGVEGCEPQLGVSFFCEPQGERVHLCATIVFDILPRVDTVVEGCPSDGAEPQRPCCVADASDERGVGAEDSPAEGDPQHDLRSGDDPLGERVESCDRKNGADEQQQQRGVFGKREQAEQTRQADEEGDEDEQQGLILREIAFRQGTGSRAEGLAVDGTIPKVVPRAPCRARGDGGYSEQKGEQEREQERE